MSKYGSRLALSLSMLAIFATGCASPEHRMNGAADRDDNRRAQFEHCRDQGRTDCDSILNAPVSSNTNRGDSVREQERRVAYNRCVDRGGSDCDDLLHRE
jgi:PBP1b-binding outer membrane lipoprotein LpoB